MFWGPPPGVSANDAAYIAAQEAAADGAAIFSLTVLSWSPAELPEMPPDYSDPDYVPDARNPLGDDMGKIQQTQAAAPSIDDLPDGLDLPTQPTTTE